MSFMFLLICLKLLPAVATLMPPFWHCWPVGNGLGETVHGLVEADEAHEPEVVGRYGDDVDIILTQIFHCVQ